MTKQQLYCNLIASNPTENILINRVDNLKELKIELCETMNKYSTILDQLYKGAKIQYYEGYVYDHSFEGCGKIINACMNIALKMNYELYSPNGFWYIKSK
jgi:hypothetical protein